MFTGKGNRVGCGGVAGDDREREQSGVRGGGGVTSDHREREQNGVGNR